MRLKGCSTVQDLLSRGAGCTPETALHLTVGTCGRFSFTFRVRLGDLTNFVDVADVPQTIWVHYEYLHSARQVTATQRIRLDAPNFKCERLAHLTNHIFAKGYLPAKMRSFVYWKGACGKVIEESIKVEDVFSWDEGLCETKPLRLVVGGFLL